MTRPASPSTSRRKVIAGIAVGAAGLTAVAAPALNKTWFAKDGRGKGSWWGRDSVSLETAGLDELTQHVGSEFAASAEGGTATLKLVAVKPLKSLGERPDSVARDRAFVAVFDAGAAAPPPGDRIYAVNHKASGDLSIYFGGATPAGNLEAVFN